MGTVVMNYGPIYGEEINGTVQGRPNGSYYVPPTNRISINAEVSARYIKKATNELWFMCGSDGVTSESLGVSYVAEAQDPSSNVVLQIYDDAIATTLLASVSFASGIFNGFQRGFRVIGGAILTGRTSVFLRGQLMINGTPISTSDMIELEVYT